MKITDLLEQITDFESKSFKEFEKYEVSELERFIRHLDSISTALQQIRDRKIVKPVESTPIMDVKQAAEYLGCVTQTIYNLVGKGKLKASRVGDSIRIRKEDLDAYLK